MKRCLKKTIGNASLNIFELNTVVIEAEAVLNSRPLTYMYSDINEGEPLTPSHFLCCQRLLNLPEQKPQSDLHNTDYIPGQESTKTLNRRARYHDRLMKSLWALWRKEYLTSLREIFKTKEKTNISTVKQGEVVIIHDNTPRNKWKLGVINTLLPGKDGTVRAVKLRTSNGKELTRPLEKLYPLEISIQSTDQHPRDDTAGKEITGQPRAKRTAAVRASQRIKQQLEEYEQDNTC